MKKEGAWEKIKMWKGKKEKKEKNKDKVKYLKIASF